MGARHQRVKILSTRLTGKYRPTKILKPGSFVNTKFQHRRCHPGFVVEQMPPLPPGSNRETAARRNFIPDEKNYSLVPQYATRGSYKEAAQNFILGLGIVVLLGEFIRRSFLYVVAGKPFFS